MAIRTTGVLYDVIARDSASRAFESIGRSALGTDRRLSGLEKSALAAGAALAGGLAAGMVVSAEKAINFQSEMKKIQTQAGGTAKDVAVLSKQVLELGKSTEQGPQALAESLYHLKSVGLDNVSAMKDLKAASDLAAVGGSDLEATSNALAGAWRSGIRGAETFGKAASSVNAIIGAGNMRMEDFVAAIGTGILPSAKSFGLSLNQVGSALALMTDEGIPAVDAATRLRMSFSLLGAPSAAADKQLKKIGLSGLDLAKAMRGPDGLIGAVGLLKEHLDKSGLSAEKQSQILSRAFGGGRSSSGILTLLNNLDVLKQKQDQINNSMGKFPAAVAAQRKTVSAQLKILGSNFDVFAIEAGTKLLPPITSFVTYLNRTAIPEASKFSGALMSLVPVDQIKSGFSTVTGFVSDFFGGLSPAKSPVITLPTPTIKAPSSVIPNNLRRPDLIVPSPTIRMSTTKIPGTVAAPAAVTSQATKLGEQLRAAFSGGIGDAIGKIDWSQLGKQVGTGLGTAFQWLTEHIADVTKKLEKAFGKVDWTSVGKTVGGNSLGFAIGFLDTMARELFSPSWWSKHWGDALIAAFSVIGAGKIAGPLGKVLEKIPVLRLAKPLLDKVASLGSAVEKPVGGILKGVGKVIGAIGKGFLTGFERIFPGITERATTKVDDLALSIFGYWARFGAAGLRLIKGLGDGILKGGNALGDVLGRVTGWVLKPFAKAGGWLLDRGSAIVDGLRSGISRGASKIGAWATTHVINPVRGAFSTAGSWLLARGSAMVSGLRSGVSRGAEKIGGWMGDHVISPVRGAFSTAGTWLKNTGGDLISGLKRGITDGVSGIGSWLKSNLVDPVVNAVKHFFGVRSPSKVFAEIGGHLVAGLMKGLATSNGLDIAKTVFGDLPSALAAIVRKGLVSIEQLPGKAVHALEGLGSKGLDLLGSAASTVFGGGHNDLVGEWATDVRTALAMLGAPMEALSPVLTRIRMESGGNPNAINLTDINAREGHPSQGLMQTIPSTFNAYAGPLRSRGITDPLANIYAGINYAMHRYGSNWVHVMTRPGGYAAGGLAPVGQTAWVGEKGPELMQVTQQGTRIFNNADSLLLAGTLGMQIPGYAAGTVSLGRARADVSAAQHRVTELERQIAELRHAEATAHTRAQRKRDELAVMAAEEELKAARKRLAAADKELSSTTAQAKRVQGVANTLANGFITTLETGTASVIASAIKSLNSKLQTAGFGGLVAGNLRTSARLQSLANQRAEIQSRIATAQQYASDQSTGLGDFLALSNIPSASISSLIARMQKQQATASGFATEVGSLSKRGLNKNLLGQVAAAGPGSQLAALLATASASDIAQLNKLAVSQQKLTVSFGQSMADSMYDSGAQAGKGFLSGLQGQEKALQAEMDRLATGMVTTIKKRLGIKSPSTVARDQLGKQFVLGAAAGVRMHAPAAVAEAQRMADMLAAVRARAGATTTPVEAGGGGPVVHHHYETNYTINARTADYTVAELELLQRKSETRQRVGRPR